MPIEEVWRPVPGYESCYTVSSLGNVRSIARPGTTGGVLKLQRRGGYLSITLSQNDVHYSTGAHCLVALAFIGPRLPGLEVRHLDGNPYNNVLENLAYGTKSENELDKLEHGTSPRYKTHCPHGHEYTKENTRWRNLAAKGNRHAGVGRVCMACDRERAPRSRHRLREDKS